MSQIPVSYTTSVNMSAAPRGLSNRVIANIGLFSNEQAGFAGEFKGYLSPSEVAKDFGSDSVTAAMANAIYAQSPNLTSGRGMLYVIPYIATNSTSGFVKTADLSSNIQNFKSVSNGQLALAIDGVTYTFSKLNFTSITTLQDIANVLLAKLPDCFIEVEEETVEETTTQKLKFTSKRFGYASAVEIVAVTNPTGIDLSAASYFIKDSAVTTAGSNAVDQETLPEAFARVAEKVYFGQILDTCFRDNASILQNATDLAASERNYFEATSSLENINVLGVALLDGGFKRTKLIGYGQKPIKAKAAIAGAVSRALATNYAGSDTCLTMNLKELATISPDSCLDLTYVTRAKAAGVDVYANQGGLSVYFSNRGAGGYVDDMTGSQAFVNDLQVAAYNYIRQVGTKVAQTEVGMTGIKNVLAKVCRQYVINGFLSKGLVWNGAEKFGNVEDFDRNIFEQAFYIYSLPIAQQSQADREDRIAPLIQLAGKSAGAIHFLTINGILEA